MKIVIVDKAISRAEVRAMAAEQFGDMIKAVIDIERGIMALGGELHVDEETLLLESGSAQKALWGVNLYPERNEPEWIEFDSMVNIRPSQGNRSRGVEDPALREKARAVIEGLVRGEA